MSTEPEKMNTSGAPVDFFDIEAAERIYAEREQYPGTYAFHARECYPLALAEIRSLRGELAETKEDLQRACEGHALCSRLVREHHAAAQKEWERAEKAEAEVEHWRSIALRDHECDLRCDMGRCPLDEK